MKYKKVYSALLFSFCLHASFTHQSNAHAEEVDSLDPVEGVTLQEVPYVELGTVKSKPLILSPEVETETEELDVPPVESADLSLSQEEIEKASDTLVLEPTGSEKINEPLSSSLEEKEIPFPQSDSSLPSSDETKAKNGLDRRRMIIAFEPGASTNGIEALEQIPSLQVMYRYNTLFEGVSVDLPAHELKKLYQIKGIKTIEESLPLEPQMMSAHTLSGVIEAQERKRTKQDGRGIVIATIDSGIDINHPDLRLDEEDKDVMAKRKIKEVSPLGSFTNKVPFGFNYLTGTYDLIDDIPTGHGMHIAGILAGNSKEDKGFHGIAPNAQLLAYKVFSNKRTADGRYAYVGDDAAFDAMENAIAHGADIISLSIGRRGTGMMGDIYDAAIRRAYEAGVVVVAAIGNYGASTSTNTNDIYIEEQRPMHDSSTLVGVSAHPKVIGVGSITNTSLYVPTLTLNNQTLKYTDLNNQNHRFLPERISDVPAVYVERGMSDEVKANNDKGLYKDKVVVVMRGGEDLKDKIARFKDAEGVVVVNDAVSYSQGNFSTHPITGFEFLSFDHNWVISLSNTDGLSLIQQIEKAPQLNMTFNQMKQSLPVRTQPSLSGFNSMGGTLDLEIKPDVVAPGEDIYSTLNYGGYGFMSGTSMASPHVAGISTLLKETVDTVIKEKGTGQQYKGLNTVDLNKLILMNTAKPLIDQELKADNQLELEYSPRRQGAGLVQLDDALKTKAIITYEGNKGSIALKQVDQKRRFILKMHNFGDRKLRYKVEHSGVMSNAHYLRHRRNENGPLESQAIHPTLIPNATLTHDEWIEIAQDGQVDVQFELNTGEANDQFVEGYIYFKSLTEGQPDLSIPYMGYRGQWSKERIFDAPVWEENSFTKASMLLLPTFKSHEETNYVPIGTVKEGDIQNPEWNAMANRLNANGHIHRVIPRIVFMRDALDYDVSIVDGMVEDSAVLHTFQTGHFARKYVHADKSRAFIPNELHLWSGDVYNPKTGEMEPLEEGQYYYRVRARVSKEAPYEVMYMPIRIDNTTPELTVSRKGQTVMIEAKDNHLVKQVVLKKNRFDSGIIAQKLSEHMYQVILPEDWESESAFVRAEDFAGNYKEVTIPGALEEGLVVEQEESKEVLQPSKEKIALATHQVSLSPLHAHDEDEEDLDEDLDEDDFLEFTERDSDIQTGLIILKSRLEKDDVKLLNNGNILYLPELYLEEGQQAVLTNVNTHYNRLNNKIDYEPMAVATIDPEDESGDWTQAPIELADGTNMIHLQVRNIKTGKLLFEKSHLIFVDVTEPHIELDEAIYNHSARKTEYSTGEIYSKNGIVYLAGKVFDNLDGWKLYVNNSMVESYELYGEFNQNQRSFYHEIAAQEGDYLHLKVVDSFGNPHTMDFKVTEKPDLIVPVRPEEKMVADDKSEWLLNKELTLTLKENRIIQHTNARVEDLFDWPETSSVVFEKTFDGTQVGEQIVKGRIYQGGEYNDFSYTILVEEPIEEVTWIGQILVDNEMVEAQTFTGPVKDVSQSLQELANRYTLQEDRYRLIGVKHEGNIFIYSYERVKLTTDPIQKNETEDIKAQAPGSTKTEKTETEKAKDELTKTENPKDELTEIEKPKDELTKDVKPKEKLIEAGDTKKDSPTLEKPQLELVETDQDKAKEDVKDAKDKSPSPISNEDSVQKEHHSLTNEEKVQASTLPDTGEAMNLPLLSTAALSILAGLGLITQRRKNQ